MQFQASLLLPWWLWRKSIRHLCQGDQDGGWSTRIKENYVIDVNGENNGGSKPETIMSMCVKDDHCWWLKPETSFPQSPSRVGMKFRRKWFKNVTVAKENGDGIAIGKMGEFGRLRGYWSTGYQTCEFHIVKCSLKQIYNRKLKSVFLTLDKENSEISSYRCFDLVMKIVLLVGS